MAVAARVKARTFEYDNVPLANAAEISGNAFNAWATRTFSRAALRLKSQRQCNHWVQFSSPHLSQPARSSNSRIRTRSS